MTTIEYIYAIAVSMGLVAGFLLEWRRGHLAERIAALEAASAPTNTELHAELHARVYELEQWRDRCRRGS